jgi:hypothetical protein
MLSDVERYRIERLVNRCKGVCDAGSLLHRLYTKYEQIEKLVEMRDQEIAELKQKGDKKND